MTNLPHQIALKASENPFGWLRNTTFDLVFIVGVAALALISGWIIVFWPKWFDAILLIDLWVLGYHHVISTYTRIAFDLESFKQYKFLVIWLPLIIVAGAIAAGLALGPWILATTYLYWQWFHYTRQSYGIARIYHIKKVPGANHHLDEAIIYLLPLAGILFRSYQNPSHFLGFPLKCLPVPFWLFQAVFLTAIIGLIYWIWKEFIVASGKRSSLAYRLFIVSHVFIFLTGYLLIDNINAGWLVINIWHNAQYIMFVWFYNNKRFKDQVNPQHRFLSYISQSRKQFLYYSVCLAISTAVYYSLSEFVDMFITIPMTSLVIYQTINFHHYVVDGIIWRVRKKPLRETLGVAG